MKPEAYSPEIDQSLPIQMYEISGHGQITKHDLDRYAKDKEQDARIQGNMDEITSFKARLDAAQDSEKISLIKEGLSSHSIEIKILSAEKVPALAEEDRHGLEKTISELLKETLAQGSPEDQKAFSKLVQYASSEDRTEIIKIALQSEEIGVQRNFIDMLWWTSKEDWTELVQLGLTSPYMEIQKMCAWLIDSLPSQDQLALRVVVSQKIEEGLNEETAHKKKIASDMIWWGPEEERDSLLEAVYDGIKNDLISSDPVKQQQAVERIGWVPEEKREELFQLVSDAQLSDEFIKPTLYRRDDVDGEKFSRQEFEKTGSEMTLLGDNLKYNTIIRHIQPTAFISWQKLYENYKAWKDNGFDYVPIEPIQSYKSNGDGGVDVFSGVLDLNLKEWGQRSSLFAKELEEQKQNILQVLEKLDIKHGHPNPGNFCLSFFRDENGHVDFKQVPRLYLIDFDQASV